MFFVPSSLMIDPKDFPQSFLRFRAVFFRAGMYEKSNSAHA
jgi:hypothetical protein